MKQQFSDMEVIVTSDRPMFEGSMATGTGFLRRNKKQFLFDARTPKERKRNPKLFRGTWFNATWSDHYNRFRITCNLTKEEVVYLQTLTHERGFAKEVRAVLKKLLSYAA